MDGGYASKRVIAASEERAFSELVTGLGRPASVDGGLSDLREGADEFDSAGVAAGGSRSHGEGKEQGEKKLFPVA